MHLFNRLAFCSVICMVLSCDYIDESTIKQGLTTPDNGSKCNCNRIILQPGPDEAQDCNTHYSYDSIGKSTWENHNNGLNKIIGVGVYDPNTVIRALIRFNLPDSICSDRLKSAKLTLHIHKWVKKDVDGLLQINIHKMLRSWKQGNFDGGYYDKGRNDSIIDGVTAFERYYGPQDGSEDWSVPGIGMNDIDASKSIYSTLSKKCGNMTAWEFDITKLVREWMSCKNQNFGMLLHSPTDQEVNDSIYSYPDFCSGDNMDYPEKRPCLILDIE